MPGPVFVSSTTQTRHGVFAIETTPPPTIAGTGTSTAAIAFQTPWGRAQELVTPASLKDLANEIAPPGMDRTGSGYLATIRKAWPELLFVRVMASTAVKASAVFPDANPTNIITVTLLYTGTAGNSVTGTISDASDGDSNHFNLTVTVTGASGSTSDVVKNINVSGTGSDSIPSLTGLLLVGDITKNAAGRPVNGTVTFSGGTTPAIASTDYVGTAGSGDKGIALFEGESSIRHVLTDDPGNTLRAAVNAGLQAHAISMGERVAYLNGPTGQTLANVKTDVANYRSDRVVYVDPWVYIIDEAGTKRLVPSSSFAASVSAQLPVSTAIAWKSAEVQAMLSGINSLEFDRGQGAGDNTTNGVCTLIREETGGFTFEADVTAEAPVDATLANLTRRRTTDYIGNSIQKSIRSYVDAPNVPANQGLIVSAISTFLTGMKNAQNTDPNHTPHILDFAIGNLAAANSQADLDSGKFTVPISVKDSSGMRQIFLNIESGEGVTITHSS